LLLLSLLVASLAFNVMAALLIVRAVRRLLQYDDIFQGILPELTKYSEDLSRMSSADLDGIMVDHPEVLAFHKRNQRALKTVKSIVDSVTKIVPERKKPSALPRPDVE